MPVIVVVSLYFTFSCNTLVLLKVYDQRKDVPVAMMNFYDLGRLHQRKKSFD